MKRPKTGGRQAGTPNKATLARQAMIEAPGEDMPREYCLKVMRDVAADSERRDEMAKALLPYFYPKLASVSHSGPDGNPIILSVQWKEPEP